MNTQEMYNKCLNKTFTLSEISHLFSKDFICTALHLKHLLGILIKYNPDFTQEDFELGVSVKAKIKSKIKDLVILEKSTSWRISSTGLTPEGYADMRREKTPWP